MVLLSLLLLLVTPFPATDSAGVSDWIAGQVLNFLTGGATNPRNALRDTEDYAFHGSKELAEHWGYPFESYPMTTTDGYILDIHRIPWGRRGASLISRPPVLLLAGLSATSSIFLWNFPHNSLGFVLADNGYDVWLINYRGSVHGKSHLRYTAHDKRFWDFGMEEVADYDVADTIDYVLNKTNQKKLGLIGASLGAALGYAILADKPEYNEKVFLNVAIAPSALMRLSRSFFRLICQFHQELQMLSDYAGALLGNYDIVGVLNSRAMRAVLCGVREPKLCLNIQHVVSGYNPGHFNESRLGVYVHHFPSGTSIKLVLQHLQLIDSGRFQKYDYGKKKNLRKYGQKFPPEFDLSKVTAPTLVLYGENDQLAHPRDVEEMARRTPGTVRLHLMENKLWSHADHLYGTNVHITVFPVILDYLERYSST